MSHLICTLPWPPSANHAWRAVGGKVHPYAKHKLGGQYRYVTDEEITQIHHHDFEGWSAWADAQLTGVPS